MQTWQLVWRMLSRDWRSGELGLLIASVAIAVGALTCVGFFAERLRLSLELEARQLLGADLVLDADRPLAPALGESARAAGLQTVATVQFPSMAFAPGGATQLVALKAVEPGYPLRGRMRVAPQPGADDDWADGVPQPGTVWIDPQLLALLGLQMGQSVRLGDATLRVDRLITLEPARGVSFVNFAPGVMIAMADLPATGLLQPTSRARFGLLVAGDAARVSAWQAGVTPTLARGQRFESVQNGARPEMRTTLDRAGSFLSLVALLTALIAAVAIALAARRFAARRIDSVAVMRAIGMTQRRLSVLFTLEMICVGVAGALLGAALGMAAHFGLVALIRPLLDLPLPPPTTKPLWQGLVAGLMLLTGFGLMPILRLAGVPALRVLRRDLCAPPVTVLLALLVGVLAFGLLLYWFAGDRVLAGWSLLGFAGGGVVFALGAWLLIRLARALRTLVPAGGAGGLVRLAISAWTRREGAAVAQSAALAIALMALILLAVVRGDLLDSWRRASPPDAPNRFIINIQPDQGDAVRATLAAAGVAKVPLWPMIRGRVVSIDGEPVEARAARARAKGLRPRSLDRELNLSYAAQMPAHNQLAGGRWVDPAGDEVSVEQGFAQALELEVGDVIGFDIAGTPVSARVSGFRRLEWDSMQVNFFMMLSPPLLADQPQTLITSVHVPDGAGQLTADLLRRFPNLTVFDTTLIVHQIQRMLDQVSRAVEYLFLFTLGAGVLVLYAALVGSRDDRMH